MRPVGEIWRNCSACKKPIALDGVHWICSVSTCNRHATSYVFCSPACWDSHLPIYRHRGAWAVEQKTPSRPERPEAASPADPSEPSGGAGPGRGSEEGILVVVSKLKAYIRDRSGLQVSQGAVKFLSNAVQISCDRAIERARLAGRKTVMERDF